MIATFLQGNIAGRCGGSWSGCATAVCDSCAATGEALVVQMFFWRSTLHSHQTHILIIRLQ